MYAKIAAASKACVDITKQGKMYETDTTITLIQHSTSTMVQASKEQIFRDVSDYPEEQQNLVYGKAGLALSLRLKTFVDATNVLLTWGVTDWLDSRNLYKKCNYCGAIFNKTEGCDGATVCGAVPKDTKKPRPKLIAEFSANERGWVIQYFWDGKEIQVQYVLEKLRSYMQPTAWGGKHEHVKRRGAVFKSGCGARISWDTMLPIGPELVASLGHVELQQPSLIEEKSKESFEDRLRAHEIYNKRILDAALS